MVNPIHIFTIALGVAFLLSLFDKIGRNFALLTFYMALAGMTFIAGQWLYALLNGGAPDHNIFTAGFRPPFSINLQFGYREAFFALLTNIAGLFAGLYMFDDFKKSKNYAMLLFLMMIMGVNGLIMTRDLFNLFVFMEITSIATYSLIGLERNSRTLSAGFKYMIAGGLASSFFLVGTIYLYRLTGTLNIDTMIASKALIGGSAGFVALLLLLAAVLIELKPFPANGWALDVYPAANSGTVSIIAVVTSAGMFFALYKILPLLTLEMLPYVAGVGMLTFLFSNLIGIKQTDAKRLLGYSSIGQMGLLIAALALLMQARGSFTLSPLSLFIIGGLFINHFLAKAGLFWLSGIVKKERIEDWSALRGNPLLLFAFGAFVFALLGFPPFPAFWAKWQLVLQLSTQHLYGWIALLLLGSLLEAVYFLRWLGIIMHEKRAANNPVIVVKSEQFLPILAFMILLFQAGFKMLELNGGFNILFWTPLLAGGILFAFDWLPARFKAFLVILGTGVFTYISYPMLDSLRFLFALIFLVAAAIQVIGTMHSGGQRRAFYPLMMMMILSLGNLLHARTSLQFFFAWELMTLSSYLLVLRGRSAQKPALWYILFSTAGAFFILAGFGLAYQASGTTLLSSLSTISQSAPAVYILLAIGFLIKTGALGVHIWLPGAYTESEDDFTPMISSILSKAGIFGLLISATALGWSFIGRFELSTVLGWIGVLTAFFGALMAIFQEDIKKLLAYSSMGQVGYMVFALAMMSHLGWVTAIYLSFNHLFFKALLFITIAGVISKTRTRKMYEMGGLIKQMPLSFISVLIAIIALSGVPPLSGFGGKWLLYTAGIERGWYLQTGLAFFASTIAFLYCFRLIHTIFLGQPKPQLKHVEEASLWYNIPAYIFILIIMAVSMFPNLILKPIISAVAFHFPQTLQWDGYAVLSSLGYWNGNAVMYVTMAVFIVPLIWLMISVGRPRKVKQFNMVYAAERPDRPETTHYAYNFFAPYEKALGFLVRPHAGRFWNAVSEWTQSLAALFRNIYTGNGQTYALQILLFVVVLYFIMGGRA